MVNEPLAHFWAANNTKAWTASEVNDLKLNVVNQVLKEQWIVADESMKTLVKKMQEKECELRGDKVGEGLPTEYQEYVSSIPHQL
jgi:hypothetical protein